MPSVVATLQAMVVELRATNAGQQATILELRATITQLQERVRDLETRVGQHSGNSSRPPSSDLPGPPKSLLRQQIEEVTDHGVMAGYGCRVGFGARSVE